MGRLLAELRLRAPELYLRGKTAETAGKRGVGSARSGIGQGPRADGGESSRKHPAAAAGTKELDPHRCLAGGELSGGVLTINVFCCKYKVMFFIKTAFSGQILTRSS